MGDLHDRMAALSPDRRALLEKQLLAARTRDQGIGRRDAARPAPLSASQQRLWFFDQLSPGLPTYNAVLAMRVTGPLRIDLLEGAMRFVIGRHEVLRTVFPLRAEGPVQQILEDWTFEVMMTDLDDGSGVERSEEAAALLRSHAQDPYDLVRDLPIRLSVVRVAPDVHLVAFLEHHIAFDGWSDEIMFRELGDAYRALAAGEVPQGEPLPIQYADFAAWQRDQLTGGALDAHLEYWRHHLQGAPPLLQLPLDHERPSRQTFRGAHLPLRFGADTADPILALGYVESATPYIVLVAGLAAVLYRWSGQDDIVLGSPVANRTRLEVESLIGFFSNTVALRIAIDGSSTFRDLVRSTRQVALGAFDHQDLPFDRVVEAVAPQRDPRHNPLFQVNVRVDSEAPVALHLPQVAITPLAVDIGFSRFDLAVEFQVRPHAIEGYIEYNLDLFEATTIADFLARMQRLLTDAVTRPDVALWDLDFSNPTARSELRRRPAPC